MRTALLSALTMFGVAIVISMGVAALIKGLFLAIRKINSPRKG